MPLAASGLAAQEPPAMKDAVTHEQLAEHLRQAQQDDPMKPQAATTGEDPSQNLPKDLLSQSDVLCFAGKATLVPKRAILLIPKALANRMQLVAGATLMGWADFYAQNRGWITPVEVSLTQAEGNEALAADVSERFKDSPNLVVATFRGGPISLLPLKVPPPENPVATTASKAKPSATPASTANNKP